MTTPNPLDRQALPWWAFDGYPYLVTYLVPAFYHIILLPAHWCLERLERLTSHQAALNRLRTCLVLAPDNATYYSDDDGSVTCTGSPQPMASLWVAFKLVPFERFRETDELAARRTRLDAFLEGLKMEGCIMGDLKRGGRRATPSDLLRLSGYHDSGIPPGLSPCPVCDEYCGETFHPNPDFRGWIIPVHCRCAAWNRCAGCGDLFSERKLNGNYFDPADGKVWQVPAFRALSHTCADTGV
ncbi:MAG: hypothetical protein OER90_14940 [Gemmatimonadota bacterium]|nr:hypothetical protein [Gemmatimonadota bacterium]